jgi:hypothetical protein
VENVAGRCVANPGSGVAAAHAGATVGAVNTTA